MRKLISDRRLWLTADNQHVVEDGDERARFLLVGCAGRAIPGAEAHRLGLTISKKGRIKYPKAPKLKGRGVAEETDDGKDDPIQHKFGNDASGGRDKIDPAPKLDLVVDPEEEVQEAEPEEEIEAADDSDRNDGPREEWPGRSSPEAYLKRYPTGPKAELATRIIAANAGADGAS